MGFKSRIAVLAASAALVAALPGAALAAQAPVTMDSDPDLAGTTAITKHYTWDEGTYSNEAFNFTMTYNANASAGYGEYGTPAEPTGYASTFSIKPTQSGTALEALGSKNFIDLFKGVEFTQPGKYVFDVKETGGSNANIKYDGTSCQIVINVVNDDLTKLKIDSAYVMDTDGHKGAYTFNNLAVDNGDLVVSKTITGNAANPEDKFDFTITLNGKLTGSYNVVESNGTNGTIAPNDEGKYVYICKLGHQDTVHIYNLPAGVTYTVTEDKGQYKATYSQTGGDDRVTDADFTQATGTIDANDTDQVDVTNNRTAVIETGYLMNIAPYALVIALVAAGAIAYVISRRRSDSQQF